MSEPTINIIEAQEKRLLKPQNNVFSENRLLMPDQRSFSNQKITTALEDNIPSSFRSDQCKRSPKHSIRYSIFKPVLPIEQAQLPQIVVSNPPDQIQRSQQRQNQRNRRSGFTVHPQELIKLKGGKLIKMLLKFSQVNGRILEKYDEGFFIDYFDRENLELLKQKVKSQQAQMGLESFITQMMSFINHRQNFQKLALAIGLRKFFRKIQQATSNQQGNIKLSDLTTYLCERIALKCRKDPEIRIPYFSHPTDSLPVVVDKIRQVDIDLPIIHNSHDYSDSESTYAKIGCIPIINKQSIKNRKDTKIGNQFLNNFIYCRRSNQVIAMSTAANSLNIYDFDFKLKKKITPTKPSQLQEKRQFIILSFAYCEKGQRIGLIVKNLGIVFYQAFDNYQTQKIIKKDLGNKIYYMDLLQQWIVTDSNTLHFIDLKTEQVARTIKKDSALHVNDVCQITHLRSIAVVYICGSKQSKKNTAQSLSKQKKEMHQGQKFVAQILEGLKSQTMENLFDIFDTKSKKQTCKGTSSSLPKISKFKTQKANVARRQQILNKWIYIYHQDRILSKIELDVAGCHTMCYNKEAQALIPLGYKQTIDVYTFDPTTFDLNLKQTLKGHNFLVTSIANISTDKYKSENQTTYDQPDCKFMQKPAMVISSDDSGSVRIWQLNYMRCLQVVKLASSSIKNLFFINLKDKQYLFFGDSRVNKLSVEKKNRQVQYSKKTSEKQQIANKSRNPTQSVNFESRKNHKNNTLLVKSLKKRYFQPKKHVSSPSIYNNASETLRRSFLHQSNIFIISKKQCRKINSRTGKTIEIFILCDENQSEEITCQIIDTKNQYFFIGTSTGKLMKYNFEGRIKWKFQAHKVEIIKVYIKELSGRTIITTIDSDSCLKLWDNAQISQSVNKYGNESEKIPTPVKSLKIAETLQVFFAKEKAKSKKLQKAHKAIMGIQIIQICFQNRFLVTVSNQKVVTIFQFQSLKILYSHNFEDIITCIDMFGCKKGKLCYKLNQQISGNDTQYMQDYPKNRQKNYIIFAIGYEHGKIQIYQWKQKQETKMIKMDQIILNKNGTYHRVQKTRKNTNFIATNSDGFPIKSEINIKTDRKIREGEQKILKYKQNNTRPSGLTLIPQSQLACEGQNSQYFAQRSIKSRITQINSRQRVMPVKNIRIFMLQRQTEGAIEQGSQLSQNQNPKGQQIRMQASYADGWLAQYVLKIKRIQQNNKTKVGINSNQLKHQLLSNLHYLTNVEQSKINSFDDQPNYNKLLIRGDLKHGSVAPVNIQKLKTPFEFIDSRKKFSLFQAKSQKQQFTLNYLLASKFAKNKKNGNEITAKMYENCLTTNFDNRNSIATSPPEIQDYDSRQSQNLIWRKKIHKSAINYFQFQKQKAFKISKDSQDQSNLRLVHTLCNDGYYKITNVSSLETICSLNLAFPLPILWNAIQQDRQAKLGEEIRQTLQILNKIIKDSNFNFGSDSQCIQKQKIAKVSVRPMIQKLIKIDDFYNLKNKRNKRKKNNQASDYNEIFKIKNIQEFQIYDEGDFLWQCQNTLKFKQSAHYQFEGISMQQKGIFPTQTFFAQQARQRNESPLRLKQNNEAQQKIILLKDQYVIKFQQNQVRQLTLKSLEAQKRVKMIKQNKLDQNKVDMHSNESISPDQKSQKRLRHLQELQISQNNSGSMPNLRKEKIFSFLKDKKFQNIKVIKNTDYKKKTRKQLTQWLSPNYYSKLMNKKQYEPNNTNVNLKSESKLQEKKVDNPRSPKLLNKPSLSLLNKPSLRSSSLYSIGQNVMTSKWISQNLCQKQRSLTRIVDKLNDWQLSQDKNTDQIVEDSGKLIQNNKFAFRKRDRQMTTLHNFFGGKTETQKIQEKRLSMQQKFNLKGGKKATELIKQINQKLSEVKKRKARSYKLL